MDNKKTKCLGVMAFDFKGRHIGTYESIMECSRVLNISPSSICRHIKDGKPLKKNGITFDEA